jgi:hypothetical protein
MSRFFAVFALCFAGLSGCADDRVVLDESGPDQGEVNDRTGQACEQAFAAEACGDSGVQYCSFIEDDLEWGPCLAEAECAPGETQGCDTWGDETCVLYGGVPAWNDESCEQDAGGETPLVLKFDKGPVSYTTASTVPFDISGRGACLSTDWPTSASPWLAIDLDRNGMIDDGSELFGSGTILPNRSHARDGFQALAVLDTNADGIISADDHRFGELVAWADEDGNRIGSLDELTPLTVYGVSAIQLNHQDVPACDERGNCEIERAAFSFDSGAKTGEIVDVHLACQ